jgi:hypothetical protein
MKLEASSSQQSGGLRARPFDCNQATSTPNLWYEDNGRDLSKSLRPVIGAVVVWEPYEVALEVMITEEVVKSGNAAIYLLFLNINKMKVGSCPCLGNV